MTEQDDLKLRQIRADHAWGFCQSMGVKNLDIPTEKGSKVTLVELLSEYREETMRTLASGMKKVLTPEELKDLQYTCDPLGSFLADLRSDTPRRPVSPCVSCGRETPCFDFPNCKPEDGGHSK